MVQVSGSRRWQNLPHWQPNKLRLAQVLGLPFSYFSPLYGPSQGGSIYQVCCRQPYDPEVGCIKVADAGGGFCHVENESDIFDYQLTKHTIATLALSKNHTQQDLDGFRGL